VTYTVTGSQVFSLPCEVTGRHERMHLTLKKEATKPASANVLQPQARFDAFVEQYNQHRPHQALAMLGRR